MMTPQLTEQYGQVLRVSLVREILSVLACAYTGVTSNPKAERATPPAIELCRNVRREISILGILRSRVDDTAGARLKPRAPFVSRSARLQPSVTSGARGLVGRHNPTRFNSI